MIKHFFAQIEGAFDGINLPTSDLGESQIAAVVSFVFILLGMISVIMIIIGGFRYVLSGAEPQKLKSAKDTILYALVGLVISISAWIIVGFVLDRT